jgi:hypothetical protein
MEALVTYSMDCPVDSLKLDLKDRGLEVKLEIPEIQLIVVEGAEHQIQVLEQMPDIVRVERSNTVHAL